jgi:hypothetical protein
VILPSKFEMPRKIGESRSIRVVEIIVESECPENPGKSFGTKYGMRKNTTALTAQIRSKKNVKTLSRNFLAFSFPFSFASTINGISTDIDTSEPIVTKRKSGIRNEA